ncbi:hypothetical protein [Photobacterium toruni]|uniref:Uncharacterized protein n=1 Tax=Photobacterium toruni TaxID=1935446 RepID=A0A1T4UJT2_9GAMM|nr:hypothetical protein [Photobacterium toruni]SKA52846.1 hypothetical protein CZ814_03352 [Photobacterium toruni]
MKCTPMIFNTEMVSALLEGHKIVTRRPLKPQPTKSGRGYIHWHSNIYKTMVNLDAVNSLSMLEGFLSASDICPVASIGDLIWVRETFQGPLFDTEKMPEYQENSTKFETPEYCIYAATDKKQEFYDMDDNLICRWRPSIHMPRWASRITLKVTDVRIERVKEITDAQAEKEGMMTTEASQNAAIAGGLGWFERPSVQFKNLWQRIYENWESNPYVWVIEFEVINQNIDKYISKMNDDQKETLAQI